MASAGEIVRAVIFYSQPGASIMQNVFTWENVQENDDGDVFAVVEAWATDNWGAQWASFAADAAEIVQVAADIVAFVGGVLTVVRTLGASSVSVPGTQAFDQQAAAVAATMWAPTGRPRSRGRKFVPSVSETSIDDGLYDAALLIDLVQLAIEWLATIDESGNVTLLPGVLSTVTEEFLPFLGTVGMDDIPDYRRTRRPDRGS